MPEARDRSISGKSTPFLILINPRAPRRERSVSFI